MDIMFANKLLKMVGRCLVEREKERSHKRVNFYSSESRIELH